MPASAGRGERGGRRISVSARLLDSPAGPRHNQRCFAPNARSLAILPLATIMSLPQSTPLVLAAAGTDYGDAIRLTLWIAGVAIVTAVCVYVVGKLRGSYRESDLDPSKLITNFRELHSQGELSDEEYRNIKAKLATQMQELLEKSKKPKKDDFDELDSLPG